MATSWLGGWVGIVSAPVGCVGGWSSAMSDTACAAAGSVSSADGSAGGDESSSTCRGGGHPAAVVVGQVLDFVDDSPAYHVVADAVQVSESVERGEAVGGHWAADGVAQVGRQRPVDVSGDDSAALDIVLLLGALLGPLRYDSVVDVAVQLVEGDVAVAVQVRAAVA